MKTVTFPYTVKEGNSSVKIYRVKSATSRDGFYYQITDYTKETDATGNPKRKLRSFGSFEEAKAEAKIIAARLAAGEVAALDLDGAARAQYGQAVENLRPTGLSLLTATDLCAEMAKELPPNRWKDAIRYFKKRNPDSLPSKTVAELVNELITVKKSRKKSDRYIQDLRNRLDRFADDFKVQVVDVDTPKIQAWLDRLKLSTQTYRNFRTVIHGLFAFAEARGYIARGTNPVTYTEKVEVKRGETQIYEPAEFEKLLNAASPHYLPSLAIGGFAGLRSAEIQRLDWSNIDLQGRFITLSAAKAKTAMRRVVPICDALAEWLADHAQDSGLIWEGDGDQFSKAQYHTASDAGVPWKANALRHSYASYRLASLGDTARVAQELGNSAVMVERHYKQLTRPEIAKEWFAIRPCTIE